MDLLNVPLIEVYQDGRKWRWKIMHAHAKEIIGQSVQKFNSRADCVADLQHMARLINAWTVVFEKNKA